MSNRNVHPPGKLRMLHNAQLMQTHEAVVDLINGGSAQYDFLFNALHGLGHFHPHHGYFYDDLTDDEYDDDDDDDNHYDGQNKKRYCGFTQNFLDKGVSKQLPKLNNNKTAKCVTPEEAAKNAKELLDEEEKLKKKAEKKKLKKMRQRERRRLEKSEKDNGSKYGIKQDAAAAPVKSKSAKNECEKKNKTNNRVPPDPGPQSNSIATESSDSCADDDDDDDDEDNDYDNDDQDSTVDELELDMSSCFVTNAAAIAKRKLEKKPKTDRKKAENRMKSGTAPQNTSEPQMKNVSEKEASEEPIKDNATKSMELAVIGNKYAQIGNLAMAVHYFTEAIKHNPQEVKLFGNRSFCYEKMQQYEKALIDADIALSLNPAWIRGLYRKGKALVGLKRYYDACLIYKEVLKIDSSCTDAAQELMRVQIMQLMDMGYTREQSSNALIIHGTVEKALEALSGLHGNIEAAPRPFEEVVYPKRTSQPAIFPIRTVSQDPPNVRAAALPTSELFPIWVGDVVPAISELKLRELFSNFGPLHSVRLLPMKRCAFINYTNKDDCEKAIKQMHGFRIAGACLIVRYPDRIHTHLGVSKAAETDTAKMNMFSDECIFWRTTGCIKNNRCTYRHVPEHKGIERPKLKP